MKTIAKLLACSFVCFMAYSSQAQTQTDIDSSFSTPGFYTTQSGSMVTAAAAQADGKMIVAGDFIRYNGEACTNILRLNTDGTRDASFDATAGTNGTIMTIVPQPDGKILLSGSFSTFRNAAVNRNLIRLNSDGAYDSSFSAPANLRTAYAATADRLVVQPDGKILVGGYGVKNLKFATYELLRLNADGSIDNSFNVETELPDYQVAAPLAVGTDGKIYLGGNFTSFAGVNVKSLVRLNADGTVDNTFQLPGGGFLNQGRTDLASVSALLPLEDGSLLVGGTFYYCDNFLSPGVVRLLPDGSIDRTFNTGNIFMPYSISRLEVVEGKVLVGGLFYSHSHQYMVLRLNGNGIMDMGFQTLTAESRNNTSYDLKAMAVLPDGSIQIAGGFNFYYGGKAYTGLAHLSGTGALDTEFAATFQQIGAVYKTLVTTEGKILVGGSFNLYGDQPVNNLVRLLPTGELDPDFQPGAGPDALVTQLAELSDGSLIIAGLFATVDGNAAHKIAKLKSDGTVDNSFATGTGPNMEIYSLLPLPNGKLMVGGAFSQFNGYSSQGLVRLLPSGSVDQSFRSPEGAPWYSIGSMAALENGQLLIGDNSDRTVHDYTLPLRVWKINEDASIDNTFKTSPQGGFPITNKLAVSPQNKIYYSGQLITGGSFTERLIPLTANGGNDPEAIPFPADFYVRDFKLLGDSAILVCGRNFSWNDSANYIMRLKPDLSIDSSFNPVALFYDLKTLDCLPDGRIVVAGEPVRFFRFATEQIPSIAVLKGTSLEVTDSSGSLSNMWGVLNLGQASTARSAGASLMATTTEITIRNSGSTAALLGDGANKLALIEGADASAFSVDVSNAANTIGRNESVVLTIRFTPTSPGIKTAQLTIPYNNGIKQKYTFQLKGTAQNVVTAVPDTPEEKETLVFPNPASGTVHLKTPLGNFNVRVYDALGRFVLEKTKQQANQLIALDLRTRGKGVYWIELRNTKTTILRQVLIQ